MATGDKKKAVMQSDIDASTLSNDQTRVPSSSAVKSAIDAKILRGTLTKELESGGYVDILYSEVGMTSMDQHLIIPSQGTSTGGLIMGFPRYLSGFIRIYFTTSGGTPLTGTYTFRYETIT